MDLTKLRYRIKALTPSGHMFTFDEVLLSGTYEENEGELAGRLQATLKNEKLAEGWIHRHVAPGNYVFLQANDGSGWKEVFRGRVYRWITSPNDGNTVEFVAYDSLYPLQQSKVHKYYKKGATAASCIKGLASEWNIPIGRIDGSHVPLSKKLYRATKIGDIFSDRLEESRKKGDRRYVIRDSKGKIQVLIEGANKDVYILDRNWIDSSEDERSIESLVTRVRIYGNEDSAGRASVRATVDGKTQFGILQDVIYSSMYDSMSEARKGAREILKEYGEPEIKRRVSGPDIPWVRKGDLIKVSTGTIGRRNSSGKWVPDDCYVVGVSHDITNLTMTVWVRK